MSDIRQFPQTPISPHRLPPPKDSLDAGLHIQLTIDRLDDLIEDDDPPLREKERRGGGILLAIVCFLAGFLLGGII